MMKLRANEFRVGNWISSEFYGEFEIVGMAVFKEGNQTYFKSLEYYHKSTDFKNIKPIPLTEDWLLKFGFEKCDSDTEKGYMLGAYKAFVNSLGEVNFCFFDFGDWYHYIEYVHQLQNLYFALTGEELTIEL